MPATPLLLAIQHNLVILGVIRNFLAVIIGAPPTLALGLTADFLLGTIQRRQKRSLAVSTTARLAQTGSSEDCEMNLRGKAKPAKQSTQFRNSCRVLTASSTTGALSGCFRGGAVAPTYTGDNGSVFHRRRHPSMGIARNVEKLSQEGMLYPAYVVRPA